MKNFGYTIQPDRQIDYDVKDLGLYNYLKHVEPSYLQCMACGCCAATCSTGQFTEFNIRRMHTLIRRGEYTSLKTEMPKCMFCGKCQLVCPRGVNLRNLILSINNAIERLAL